MDKIDDFDLANTKLVLRFVDRDFSRYILFIPLFKFSKSFLKLEDKFSFYLRLNYKSKRFQVHRIANLITNLICCGVDRFVRMDDEYRIEKGLAKSLGFFEGFPTSDTIYRFLKAFSGFNVNQLERVNLEILKEQKNRWFPATGSVFIDLDMNTKSVEGKKIQKAALGYNRKNPGRLSLNWTVGHISKIALFSQLHPGITGGSIVLKNQVKRIEGLIRKLNLNLQSHRFVWRVDGGYFSWNNLVFLNKRKFITRIKVNLKLLKPYLKDKKVFNNLVWQKYTKASYYTDLGEVKFPECELYFRVVLVKTYKGKKQGKHKILLYPLCTNLFDWKAKSIVKAYRGRQIVENCFRDTNQAFYSNKLPSSTFHGNQAFLWFIVLAYNLFFFFQKFQSPN